MPTANLPSVMSPSAPPRRRARRWTAPLAALGSLVVLWWTYVIYSLAQMTFLEVPETEDAALAQRFDHAARHAWDLASTILLVAGGVVLFAGLFGAVRPVRRGGLLIVLFTVLAIVAVWAATRADIALLDR